MEITDSILVELRIVGLLLILGHALLFVALMKDSNKLAYTSLASILCGMATVVFLQFDLFGQGMNSRIGMIFLPIGVIAYAFLLMVYAKAVDRTFRGAVFLFYYTRTPYR